ncbi:major facilitator superfamily domain-containing protein [Obelidium mucronatum]|nr:major facilitator superfamily domain-containing protein [Obelidium mucronatum]
MLGPTYPYMVKFLLPGEDRIGYFAGLLQSAYFLPTIVCAPVMGFLSDKYGRKPVLLCGLMGYGFGTMLLGLSTSFHMSLFSLFFTGCFAGNTIVAKGMIGELTKDDKSRALGYSWYGIVYGVCGVIGAIMGGVLADPMLYEGVPVLETRPYLLACSIGVFTAAVAGSIVHLMLQKPSLTHPNDPIELENSTKGYNQIMFDATEEPIDLSSNQREKVDVKGFRRRTSGPELDITDCVEMETMETLAEPSRKFNALSKKDDSDAESDDEEEDLSYNGGEFYHNHIKPYLNIMTRKTIVPLALYSLFALSNAIFLTALSLIAAAPVSRGGYNLSQRVAFWSMSGYASVKILVKAFYYRTNSVLGTRWTYRLGVGIMIPAVLFVPARFGLNWKTYWASVSELAKNSTIVVASSAASTGLSTTAALTTSETVGVIVKRSLSSIGNKIHDGGYEVPVAGLVVLTSMMGLGDGLTYLSVVMVTAL